MRTFKITLAYRGTNYAGWQLQPGQVTVQGTLEGALAKITGETIRTVASGRTDAGTHALGQVVSFQSQTHLAPQVLQAALNAELPHDMAVLAAREMPADFHAIASVRRKRYRYVIDDEAVRDVFAVQYAWFVHRRLDVAAMHAAAQHLLGTHDFSSFESQGSPRASSVRTIFEAAVVRGQGGSAAGQGGNAHRVTIEVEADGFLYHMVRAIAGTLLEVGLGEQQPAWLGDVIAARNRAAAGRTAPAHGLFLVSVTYDEPHGAGEGRGVEG